MLYHANSSDKKARISMLILDKIDFKHKETFFFYLLDIKRDMMGKKGGI